MKTLGDFLRDMLLALALGLLIGLGLILVFGILGLLFGGKPWTVNLLDKHAVYYVPALVGQGLRSGLFIFIFRQFFRSMPKELEDAAHLDGCGPFATFVRIMVPNARTSYLTVFIFSLVWYWNDTYVTGMFYDSSTTVALEVGNLFNTISAWLNNGVVTGVPTNYMVWIEAGCLLSILPIVIIYCFLQRYFIEGIERSGITGT